MTTTIKLEDSKKLKLEKFVARLFVKEGIKVTFQEALGLMVDYSLENEEDFVEKKLKIWLPLEKDPAWKMHDYPDDWNVTDASQNVDEFVYGSEGKQRPRER
jgi:hypothetical protein